jgi:hypothetical protein
MKTEIDFRRNKLNELMGVLVLLAIGVIGGSTLAAWFYFHW